MIPHPFDADCLLFLISVMAFLRLTIWRKR